MDAGQVGSHSSPSPAVRTISAIPGRSDATTGTPAAIASHSFWGVVNSWLVELGWDRHHHHVRGRCPAQKRLGWDGRQYEHLAGKRRLGGHSGEMLLPHAVPEQHQHCSGDLEDGLHRLLDAALAHELALGQDDRGIGRDADCLAHQVGPRVGRRPAVGGVEDDWRPRDAQLPRDQIRISLVHCQDLGRPWRAQRRSRRSSIGRTGHSRCMKLRDSM